MSADVGLGLPHNWISYAALQHMIAKLCNLRVGNLVYFVNDLHIYSNHYQALMEMEEKSYSDPTLSISEVSNINEYKLEDFALVNYKTGPSIKLTMAL